ncbi:MAG: hypothetical protein GY822_17310 [Deltaproteobacteria bacterium]|nr:hypothetical protein [Deltaproteobacteria bacterium]
MALGRVVSPSDIKRVRSDGSSLDKGESLESLIKKRVNKDSSYQKYKEGLGAFFGGDKPLPDHIREHLQDAHGAEEAGVVPLDEPQKEAGADKKKRVRRRKNGGMTPARAEGKERKRRIVTQEDPQSVALASIRKANSPREVKAAVDGFFASGYDLPKEIDLLSKVLGHSDDVVLARVLITLREMELHSETKGGPLLKTRLENVSLLTGSSDVRGLCSDIMNELKNTPPVVEDER